MPKPQEYTNTFIVTKKLFLVGLGGHQSISNPVERPCIISVGYQKTTYFLQTETDVSTKDGKFAKARSKSEEKAIKVKTDS